MFSVHWPSLFGIYIQDLAYYSLLWIGAFSFAAFLDLLRGIVDIIIAEAHRGDAPGRQTFWYCDWRRLSWWRRNRQARTVDSGERIWLERRFLFYIDCIIPVVICHGRKFCKVCVDFSCWWNLYPFRCWLLWFPSLYVWHDFDRLINLLQQSGNMCVRVKNFLSGPTFNEHSFESCDSFSWWKFTTMKAAFKCTCTHQPSWTTLKIARSREGPHTSSVTLRNGINNQHSSDHLWILSQLQASYAYACSLFLLKDE